MQTIYIPANKHRQIDKKVMLKGDDETYKLDLNAWSDDNGNITACVITVETGNVTIDNESLASNVKQFQVTTTNVGRAMIKYSATAGNNTYTGKVSILTKDPQAIVSDYGICHA